MKKKTITSKSIKKYQGGGTTITTTIPHSFPKGFKVSKPNPKTISPFDYKRKAEDLFKNPEQPVKPTPPSYRMKKGGSITKSKKK